MRVSRWRWLVPVVIVVAGCLARPTLPPASFFERVQSSGASFAVAIPPSGAMTMDEAIDIAEMSFRPRDTPVEAIYGTVTCPDATTCTAAFDAQGNVSAFPVWVVWPLDTTDRGAGFWLAVAADTGKGGDFVVERVVDPDPGGFQVLGTHGWLRQGQRCAPSIGPSARWSASDPESGRPLEPPTLAC